MPHVILCRKIQFGIPAIKDSCVPIYVMTARGVEV